MKKLFAKVTAAISAAAMLAVPTINAFPANAALSNYYRTIWTDNLGVGKTARNNILVGDANGNSEVTVADATAILQHLQNPKYKIKDQNQLLAADVNGDGFVDETDANIIQSVDAGVTTFENEQTYFKELKKKGIYNPGGTYRIFLDGKKYSAVLLGDVNNNGKVTIADITSINQALAPGKDFHIFDGGLNGNDYIRAGRAADINNDGAVTQADIEELYDIIS